MASGSRRLTGSSKNRLKELRVERGLTQSEFVAVIGVWRKTINTVEKSSTTLALAEAVGMRGEKIVYQGPEREE